jgi:ABC-2 type transport system permease protein
MKHGMALLVHSLRRFRLLLTATGLILAAFQVLFCFAAVALAQSDSIGKLAAIIPAPIREALGPGLVTMVSFSGIACLGYFHIALIGVLAGVITAVATEPAAEMESGFIDLILSHPLPRYWIVLRSFLLVALATLALVGSMSLGSILGILWIAPEYREMLGTIKLLAINLGALMLAWGSIALALASFARRRAIPATAAGILVMTTYITDYLGRIWEPARRVSWLSPFHYYDPVGIIASVALPESNIWILAGTAAASTLTALAIFSHRDI